MIFITLGSQKFQFNRLLVEIDKLIMNKIIKEKVFAQIGYSDYEPKYYESKHFLDRNEFVATENKASLIISHGGSGAIIGALKKGKKVIAVPRLAKYGEHVDDHQLQLIKQFESMDLIVPCYELSLLKDVYSEVNEKKLKKYESSTVDIITSIKDYIRNV